MAKLFQDKVIRAFMITWVTHNSRVSERMVEYGVKMGEPVVLGIESEKIITQSIARIIKSDCLRVLAYNICRDHVHMILVCMPKELTGIVQKLKSISSREHNVARGWTTPVKNVTAAVFWHSEVMKMPTSASQQQGVTGGSPSPQQGVMTPCCGNVRGGGDRTPCCGNVRGGNDRTPCRDNAHQTTVSKKSLTQTHLWAQKFHRKMIRNEAYLKNALHYVKHNREKHQLPRNIELQKMIDDMCCTLERAFDAN